MFALTDLHLEGFRLLSPELTLVTVSLVILVMDLFGRGRNMTSIALVSLAGLALTAFQLVAAAGDAPSTAFGLVAVDKFGNFFKLFTCAALAVVIFFVMSDRREKQSHIGEYYFLLLGASVGIFFMVSTNNLLLLMLGLELLSLASYSLAGFHKGEKRSAEAAMKYIVFGGLSAGVMVYGISLLYGLTGTLNLQVMAGVAGVVGEGHTVSLATAIENSPGAVAAAMVLILGGFSYKISVAPFHFWAPDVYEGAPTPVTTLMATGTKAAAFAFLLNMTFLLPADAATMIGVIAVLTMAVGNLGALVQSDLKRMLAWSGIAHAGTLLIVVAGALQGGLEAEARQAALYYMAAYVFTAGGAFGLISWLEADGEKFTKLENLAGLAERRPGVAAALSLFMLSLGGIPATGGFLGKWFVFSVAVQADMIAIAVVAVLLSVVALAYYLRVIVTLYMKPAPSGMLPPMTQKNGAILATTFCAAMVLCLGVLPGAFVGKVF